MEFSTTLMWILGVHIFMALWVSMSVLLCPFRLGTEKFFLFLATWLIPILGSIFVKYHIGSITIKNKDSTRGGTTYVDIPSSSSDYSGSDGGGTSD